MSLPLWECGLKCIFSYTFRGTYPVTPFMGVWIEIILEALYEPESGRHSLYGSVD